jgi:hypothetical protein
VIKLDDFAETEDHHAVARDDRVQAMGDYQHSRGFELFGDQGLDLLLGDHIYTGGGFVKNNHFRLTEDSSADANQLLLSRTQVSSPFCDLEAQASSLDNLF